MKKGYIVILMFALIFLSTFSLAEKPEDVKLNSYVNDYAGVLNAEQKASLETTLKDIYDSGKAEFAVATVNNMGGMDRDSFAYAVAEGNLGKTGANNGLLLLVSIEDRQYKFEVGRGLEPILNDAKVGRIGRDYIVPNFQKGDYYTGIDSSVNAVKGILDNQTDEGNIAANQSTMSSGTALIMLVVVFIFVMLIISIIKSILNAFNNKRRPDSDYFLAGGILGSMLGGRGGFGGGGFGGGGFGGFGGGSFGGGGAGGGW